MSQPRGYSKKELRKLSLEQLITLSHNLRQLQEGYKNADSHDIEVENVHRALVEVVTVIEETDDNDMG